jgi:hypothetical protein
MLELEECRLRSMPIFENSVAGKGTEVCCGVRRGGDIAASGANRTIAPVVHDYLAAAAETVAQRCLVAQELRGVSRSIRGMCDYAISSRLNASRTRTEKR